MKLWTDKKLKIGGDVKSKNTSDFSFPGVGEYELTAGTGDTGL